MSKKKLNEEASAKKIDKIKNQQKSIDKKEEDIKKLRKQIKQEVDYTMDGSVKQLFLNLTKMQIPFDYENTLEEFFPEGMKTDPHGNYYIKIGDTKSMFCAHLDTYCYEYKRVWHVIDGDIIKTDGTTTLGGDDKAGIVVMIKMIEAGVPGLYYFFRGEEGVTSPTGTWGSKQALKSFKDNFSKYDRCIAFDRRDKDSIITQQMYSECCSDEFAEALVKDLGENGLTYIPDPTGMWCDSGVFMETIPECTNISMGYDDEHTFKESQDIAHLEKLVEACIKIDWENLPTKRDPSVVSYGVGRYHYDWDYQWDHQYGYNKKKKKKKYKGDEVREYTTMDDMFDHVVDILDIVGYDSLNDNFEECEEMYFQNYDTGDFFGLRIIDYDIYLSEDDRLANYMHIGDLDTFEKYVTMGMGDEEEEEEYTEEDHLDDYQRRHLDAISSELRGSDDDVEITYSGEDEQFTINQDNAFKKFTKKNKELVKQIMDDIDQKKVIEVRPDTWLAIEKAMIDTKLVVDYGDYGINPDDYIDWMAHNWDYCARISNEKDEESSKPTLSEADTIFYDIALNKKRSEIEQFIKQVIEKDILVKKENYRKYQKTIEGWIAQYYKNELDNNYKDINYVSFINWIKEHKRDLLEYYK